MYYYILVSAISLLTALYFTYQRTWHPLAGYPGPFWGSITDFYNVRAWWRGNQPGWLRELHAQYGPVVRYGPNRLSFTSPDTVKTIFVKGFKTMPKTEWYDAFGSSQFPNAFNARDIPHHFARRKHLLKVFSPQAMEKFEPVMDEHINVLRRKVRGYAKVGSIFNIKKCMYEMVCDIIADLMYGEKFNIQGTGKVSRMPDDHKWAAFGATWAGLPFPLTLITPLLFLLPHPQAGYKRNVLSYLLESDRFISKRFKELESGTDAGRADIITKLWLSNRTTLEKGETAMSDFDMKTELLGFVFAGIHPPSASLSFLFWNLLHNPQILDKATEELRSNLPAMTADRAPYTLADVERHLPWTKACIKESFRHSPAFTMTLARYVVDNETKVNGSVIPKGTSVGLCNHAFHHNPDVFGQDHRTFDPSRWDNDSNGDLSSLLMHFGVGGRQCIGKTLANSIIHKLTATLLAEFSFELADQAEQKRAVAGDFIGQLPEQFSVSISDVKGPIMVQAHARS